MTTDEAKAAVLAAHPDAELDPRRDSWTRMVGAVWYVIVKGSRYQDPRTRVDLSGRHRTADAAWKNAAKRLALNNDKRAGGEG